MTTLRPWFRFSLRTSFVLLTVVGVSLGVYMDGARKQKAATDAILALGGQVGYAPQVARDRPLIAKAGLRLRGYLAAKLGPEFAWRIEAVSLYPDSAHPADEQVKLLKGLPRLKTLAVWPGDRHVSSLDMSALGGLTDRGVGTILRHLPDLRHLSVTAAQVTDAGVVRLLNTRSITSLQINRHPNAGDHPVDFYCDKNGLPHLVISKSIRHLLPSRRDLGDRDSPADRRGPINKVPAAANR